MTLIELSIVIILILLILCCLIPKAREEFLFTFVDSLMELWGIVTVSAPKKRNGFWSFPLFVLALTLASLVTVLFIVLMLSVGPAISIIEAIKHNEESQDFLQFNKEVHVTEEIIDSRFTVNRINLPYEPDEHEVFYFAPERDIEVENTISSQYHIVKNAFEQRHLSFVFLPNFNKELNVQLNTEKLRYNNPMAANLLQLPFELLSYQDIKEALKIPNKIDGPCFIRCMRKYDDPLVFSYFKIDLTEDGDIMHIVQEYLNKVKANRFYSLKGDNKIREGAEGEAADERFDEDVYLIGKEIKERVERLRAKGLSYLAIKKLIGDDSDKPSKLFIDKNNKIFLPDYNNKEIKLSPIHKAVFFLFLNHPEGIYFKDLHSYKEELKRLYVIVTGREDLEAIEESIDKLTDPYDNSINEKCARIKNAFVSEFREELARWYFIDGRKGEKKTIKIPRDLVTWEIKA